VQTKQQATKEKYRRSGRSNALHLTRNVAKDREQSRFQIHPWRAPSPIADGQASSRLSGFYFITQRQTRQNNPKVLCSIPIAGNQHDQRPATRIRCAPGFAAHNTTHSANWIAPCLQCRCIIRLCEAYNWPDGRTKQDRDDRFVGFLFALSSVGLALGYKTKTRQNNPKVLCSIPIAGNQHDQRPATRIRCAPGFAAHNTTHSASWIAPCLQCRCIIRLCEAYNWPDDRTKQDRDDRFVGVFFF